MDNAHLLVALILGATTPASKGIVVACSSGVQETSCTQVCVCAQRWWRSAHAAHMVGLAASPRAEAPHPGES